MKPRGDRPGWSPLWKPGFTPPPQSSPASSWQHGATSVTGVSVWCSFSATQIRLPTLQNYVTWNSAPGVKTCLEIGVCTRGGAASPLPPSSASSLAPAPADTLEPPPPVFVLLRLRPPQTSVCLCQGAMRPVERAEPPLLAWVGCSHSEKISPTKVKINSILHKMLWLSNIFGFVLANSYVREDFATIFFNGPLMNWSIYQYFILVRRQGRRKVQDL